MRERIARLAPAHAALVLTLAGSAILNFHRLSQNGYANTFYSAAVRSMLRSWHNFFFVSFDPGGLVSIDKPPIAIWTQAASAELFGFSHLSLLAPQALAAVLCVGLMYHIVSPRFGPWAGVIAALTLAVFPSFVAVSRDNNPDTMLILLMLLACAAMLRAIEQGRLRSLLLAGLWVGLAFNTKQLAAFLVVPGLGLAFLICGEADLRRRLLALAAAGALMAVVACSWSAIVDSTSPAKRPFVGSSNDNSEFGLAFSYNGVGRVGGQYGGPGRLPQSELLHRHKRKHPRLTTQRPQHDVGPVVFGGPTGPLRLVRNNLGAQGGWVLPFALIGLIAGALTVRDRRDRRLALLLALGGWFLVEAVILSFSNGIVHPYYVSALGPGVAAMVGAGAVALGELARRRRRDAALLALALAGTAAVQIVMLHRDRYLGSAAPILVAVCLACLAAALARRRWAPWAALAAAGALQFAPAVYSWTLWEVPTQGTFPAAGPHAAGGAGDDGLTAPESRIVGKLVAYVRRHQPARRFPLLTESATTAAPFILEGFDAAALGGYGGTDPAIDPRGLGRLLAAGDARYVLLGGAYADRGGNSAIRAVPAACTLIRTRTWRGQIVPITRYSFHLYDCAGAQSRLS
ncbi:MAG: hypothetical protein NVSMB51_09430 [Solirubrobacteraceae bacterium]